MSESLADDSKAVQHTEPTNKPEDENAHATLKLDDSFEDGSRETTSICSTRSPSLKEEQVENIDNQSAEVVLHASTTKDDSLICESYDEHSCPNVTIETAQSSCAEGNNVELRNEIKTPSIQNESKEDKVPSTNPLLLEDENIGGNSPSLNPTCLEDENKKRDSFSTNLQCLKEKQVENLNQSSEVTLHKPTTKKEHSCPSTAIEITQSNCAEDKNSPSLTSTCLEDENQKQDSLSTNQQSLQDELKEGLRNESMPTKNIEVYTTGGENCSTNDKYTDHVTYTEDGTAVYTDPETKYQYKWSAKESTWVPSDFSTSTNPYENEHYKWCNETQTWLPKHSSVTETEHYKWDSEKNQWVAKVKDSEAVKLTNPSEIVYDIDEDGQRTYTDKDGTIFFWDVEKKAWFPKIDEDFMARYQMNYGFIGNTSQSENEKEKLKIEETIQRQNELTKMIEEAEMNEEASKDLTNQSGKRKGQQEPPKWFEIDPDHNTKVYVSNLPLDITMDEFADVMGKCGMIMRDPQTQKFKLKLYTEPDGQIKGDGLCDYIKVESVDLALKILDEYNLRGHKIKVQRAQFQMRGEYNPALKPKRRKKDKEKFAKIKEKLFDWRPEKLRGERFKHEKTVIIKNLFHPDLFEKEVQLILDYQNDLREECSKCGTVRKVVIYDRHSEGVAQVNMSSPEEADLVIQMMNGRFFGKRQLTADHWDGKTKYKVEETEEDVQKRLNKWDQYLETDEHFKSDLEREEEDIEKTIKFEPVMISQNAHNQKGPNVLITTRHE